MSLEVHPERGVLVRAPLRMPQGRIDAFLKSREAWLQKQLQALDDARSKRGPRRYEDGETFTLLGDSLELRHEPGKRRHHRPRARRAEGAILLALNRAGELAGEARRSELRQAVVDLYRDLAKADLPLRVRDYCLRLNLPQPPVAIAHQRRRWGSCSSRHGIRLNLRLMLCDEELVNYVVAHEVCHLKEMNHGPNFHRLLEGLIPDARRCSRRLAKESETYRL